MDFNQIKTFFQNNHINKTITINGCERIENVNKTVDSLIYLLEHKNEGCYQSYYKTLVTIYNKINN